MKTPSSLRFITVILFILISSPVCRRVQDENDMLLKPWTGIFFEERDMRSLGLRGPVSEVLITEHAMIRYDSSRKLLTDTGSMKPDSETTQTLYRFDHAGRIVASVEDDNDVSRKISYRRGSNDIRKVMITGNNAGNGSGDQELLMMLMQMQYKKGRLRGIQARLEPFDLEDHYKDISLRSDFQYVQQGDSNTCTETGAFCITVRHGFMKPADSLDLIREGFISHMGTDSFFYPFKVMLTRNRKGAMLSRITEAPGSGFYGIIVPGKEQLKYAPDGKLQEMTATGEIQEHVFYNKAGSDSLHIKLYTSGEGTQSRYYYDLRGNKIREEVTLLDSGKFVWSRNSTYCYDGRDSLISMLQTGVMNPADKFNDVPFFSSDPWYTRYSYSEKGLLREKVIYRHDSLMNEQVSYQYDGHGQLIRQTDIEFIGGVKIWRIQCTVWQYDAFRNPVRMLQYIGDELVGYKRWDYRYY